MMWEHTGDAGTIKILGKVLFVHIENAEKIQSLTALKNTQGNQRNLMVHVTKIFCDVMEGMWLCEYLNLFSEKSSAVS